ncbi:hypothetical protein C0Q70_09544 [Pomacea canaliculata]|uniref:Uncharacterized protein n=1 Tax=Pomacea canaliculata TaxID=400727 RepID=A0A2T7PA33_POMCA|nr:hypothetical protein C0Q70_09544 [Pomacea canaliculata]
MRLHRESSVKMSAQRKFQENLITTDVHDIAVRQLSARGLTEGHLLYPRGKVHWESQSATESVEASSWRVTGNSWAAPEAEWSRQEEADVRDGGQRVTVPSHPVPPHLTPHTTFQPQSRAVRNTGYSDFR